MILNGYTTGAVTSGMAGAHLVQRNESNSMGQP
jgi:hypothetical protein